MKKRKIKKTHTHPHTHTHTHLLAWINTYRFIFIKHKFYLRWELYRKGWNWNYSLLMFPSTPLFIYSFISCIIPNWKPIPKKSHMKIQVQQLIYIYIYIYICVCVCVCVCVCTFLQHFLINTYFIEHNRHFLSTYF